jgi:hypothetical protein
MNFYKWLSLSWLLTAVLIVVAWGGFVALRSAMNPEAAPFGCDKTFINARGEDTGECQ